MTGRTVGAVALAIGGSAVVVARQLQRRAAGGTGQDTAPRSRWRAVTVNRSPEEVMPDGPPGPLAELGDLVEVEVRPAPGDKGTELRARLKAPEPTGVASAAARVSGHDPRQRVRAALREAKQLTEVGEVLRVDPAPHGRRAPTPGGAIVETATRRAGGEGLL